METNKELIKLKTVSRLREIADLIEKGKYKKVNKYLSFSPAGDDMGCNNHFIDFDDILQNYSEYKDHDLSDVLDFLSGEKG